MWLKYKSWFAYLALLILVTCLTIWCLLLNPQSLPLFLSTIIIALGFAAVIRLFPKYRQRFIKKLIEYQDKSQKKGGLLFRYGKIFFPVMLITLTVFSLVARDNPAILDIPYVPYLVFVVFIAFLISFVTFISGFLRGYGKWGLIIIGIITALTFLRIMISRHL